jgi:hypothetical protein
VIDNVRQAGEQVDDALLNLAEAVADLLQAQAPISEVCPQTQQAFNRANQILMGVIGRKLDGFAGFHDNPLLADSFLDTFSQHLPNED